MARDVTLTEHPELGQHHYDLATFGWCETDSMASIDIRWRCLGLFTADRSQIRRTTLAES